MIAIFSIFLLILSIWFTLKIVPAILGFAFSIFLVILQVIGILLFIPVFGLLSFFIVGVFVFLIVKLFSVLI